MSASTLFDRLRQEHGLQSDKALANDMGIRPCDISKARKAGRISSGLILRVHEHFGLPVVEIRQVLGQPAPQQYQINQG